MKTTIYNKGVKKVARRMAACCLLLFAMAGNAWAQSDGQFVIKKTNYNNAGGQHYLAHVKVDDHYELRDATTFGPDCLWYSGREISLSGTNHNYYFIDDNNQYRFLSAPLSAGGSLSLSDSQPPIYLLNNTDHDYYFYDWDSDNGSYGAGVARGHQYNGIISADDCNDCGGNMEEGECWEVYWVECYDSNVWKLSTNHSYNITPSAGRFRLVTVESFPLQVSEEGGGLSSLENFEMEFEEPYSHDLSATVTPFNYIPAYKKYDFDEVTVPAVPANPNANPPVEYVPPIITHHTYYYPYGSANIEAPTPEQAIWSGDVSSQWTYNWTLSGAGAAYLSFSDEGANMVHSSTSATPTLYYRIQNTTGHKTATLTLTVTYQDGSTQTSSAQVTVKTPCQNPSFSANVTYEGVIVSWTPTAESYTVSWKKADASEWSSHQVNNGDVTSDTITGLEYETTYDYKVQASCDQTPATSQQFTTLHQPTAVVGGAVFGGGRMANVGGKTEVVIINTDSIGAVYGGNDIAGAVLGAAGSTIKLGVTNVDPDAVTYNNSVASSKVRIGDVYGGGNGYYAYNGSSFVPADDGHTSFVVPNNGTVNAMTQSHTVGAVVWTNNTGDSYTMVVPTITKTTITMVTNAVKVDSIFGGAKNAFITNADPNANGTSITVDGGTAFAVFGGNNFGGNQTAGKHHIEVNNTKSNSTAYPAGLGRNYGIGYVFGGGNKVVGLTTDITITGGMCDTVFAGGNAADVGNAQVVVNCPSAKTFTRAVSTWDEDGNINGINEGYAWNGTGLYNVRALFGGNNRANMAGLPTITLTRGSVGTVYGGGNAGKMLAQIPDDEDPEQDPGTGPLASDFEPLLVDMDEDGTPDKQPIYYSTHVIVDKPTMLVDYLYGGCQMSDVKYSTWVEVKDGHVGTVYGGCNISGDVGSGWRLGYYSGMPKDKYQLVNGSTYVKASGGTIYENLFAGSNGYYHCNDGIYYIDGVINFGHYIGDTIPTHNETRVMVSGTAIVKKNVYAGGNMAYVGFINATDQGYRFRDFVGFCSVKMDGGVVEGSVYGGGNRASVFGSNAVRVSGGSIGYVDGEPTDGALYGGNDRAGQVAQITNRVLPESYSIASDGATNLKILGVKTYVGIDGKPKVSTVYGGGNGAYDYTPEEYCDITDQPVQSNTFVDVNIDADGGVDEGGYINTVYGGGNGVTVLDRITVFVNVANMPTGESAYDQVGTIFGGNNKGDLDILSDIIMLNGQVKTIYGGCNEGAMVGSLPYNEYSNLGSMVHLRDKYKPNGTGDEVSTNAKVTGFVYGGCRSNGVSNNTLVLVDGGEHPATFFGGSDVSGIVGGTTQVIVTDGSTGNVYGGGNGNYEYTGGVTPPYCNYTHVEALGGTCTNNVFGGGYAGECGETYILVNGGTVTGSVYGGGNQAGVTIVDTNPDPEVAENTTGNSTVNMYNGFVGTGVYGGCNAEGSIAGDVAITLTGGTIGTEEHPANVHGGGYGQPTTVAGDVLINFGQTMWDESGENPVEIHNDNLNIYGDIYGGSAFGSVNTDAYNITTINIHNGTVNGNVYGGGLGDDDDNSKGWVNGVVHINVGGPLNENTFFGSASFTGRTIDGARPGTAIFGGNNLNGSPQADVYVYVYQTAHTEKDLYDYTSIDREYAIYQVFGGGNKANYAPDNGSSSSEKSSYVHIFGCENTVQEVFGGSNAAHSISASTVVEGGRFNFIFGGGNGIMGEANVGIDPQIHKTYSQILGGHVGWCFGGSNRLGNCVNIQQDLESGSSCGELVIDYFFQGGNQADQYGEMVLNFTCSQQENYLAAYGGCRLGTVYGNITVNMTGGTIGALYGGCQGSMPQGTEPGYAANVKRFPTIAELEANPDAYSQELKAFLTAQYELGYNWYGKGGNITVNVRGGAIGNLYGGCDTNGNVDGKITVIVENEQNDCGLFVGNVYGASNHTPYEPENDEGISPKVNIIKGTIGGQYSFNGTLEEFEGNVFGGGNLGSVISSPKVIIGDGSDDKPVNILGSVYGGGNQGNVTGNPNVIVDPDTRTLTVYPPQIVGNPSTNGGGSVIVGTTSCNTTTTTEINIGEDVDVVIMATPNPATASGGYLFDHWNYSGNGTNVVNENSALTTFTMGTTAANLTAYFRSVPAHQLYLVSTPPEGGTFLVNGVLYTGPIWIAEGASVTVEAVPATGYIFGSWTVGSGSISTTDSVLTTFTMGNTDATLRAQFTELGRINNRNTNR